MIASCSSARIEDGFNDFGTPNNCYLVGVATYNLVGPSINVPGAVHGGNFSAAFTVNTMNGPAQARCYVNTGLPEAAYYSAWFNILSNETSSTDWTLLHWQGPLSDGGVQYLWDVSLVNEADGSISPAVVDYAVKPEGPEAKATSAEEGRAPRAYQVVCESGMQGVYRYPPVVAPTRSRSDFCAFM